jgi:DNA polymerase
VFGSGDESAEVVFVGEGPGAEEDRQGVPFVGRSGQLLDRLIAEELGSTRSDCAVLNIVKCRPPGNRDPKPDEVETCWPYLDQQLDLIQPKVVMTLGNFASKQLLDTDVGITKLRGQVYPFRGGSLVPTFHPAAALRGGGVVLSQMRSDFVRAKLLLEST